MRRVLALALALPLWNCGGADDPPTPTPSPSTSSGACAPASGTPALTLRRVVGGLSSPVDVQAAPGDARRLFVVEQAGRIRVVRDGALMGTPFLDIAGHISSGGERGLLGLAFHPSYATNGRLFVNYTDPSGNTHLAEFRVTSDPDRADPATERTLLTVDQPFANHNGGGLRFGRDGMLYAGLGDGGSGGDPFGNGQNLGTLLGKLLRIDVDRGTPYAVPADNPFVGRSGARPEIWAFGLRNPWRFSFDAETGDLVIGDVGQGEREEIDVGLASRRGGENYGWNVMEGTRCYAPSSGCNMSGLTLPVLEYGHGEGCSVTGGIVYRGCRLPGYRGTYFYSDYCTAFVRSFRLENGRAVDARDWTSSLGVRLTGVSAFGTDNDGELYVLDYNGTLYQLVPAS
jgi:glucose/arabinose dehydrogenase